MNATGDRATKKHDKPEPLSWTAWKRGDLMCSPACGGRCTVAAHKKAKASASELCASLGVGWKPSVWENLGWHYGAISPCGRLKVYPLGVSRGYHAFLGDKETHGGGRWVESGRTAKAAIRNVVARGMRERDEIYDLIRGLHKSVGGAR